MYPFVGFLLLSLFLGQSALAWSILIGVGERYAQSSIENTSTGISETYVGYGIEGELRLKLGGGVLNGAAARETKATPELFILGGTLSQQNSASNVGYHRKVNYVGGGLDFRFEHLFIGGQVVSNSSTLETTTATTAETFSSLGLRLGYGTSIGLPTSGVNLLVGVTSGMGRTPASSSPVSIIVDNAVFILLDLQLFKSALTQ